VKTMDPTNIIAKILARVGLVESAVQELRSATGTLAEATVVDKDSGARMTLRNGQLKIWPNFEAAPEVFTLLYADANASRMVRWFAPTAAGGNVLANSFSMQGSTPTLPGNMWMYTDGTLVLDAAGRIVLDAPFIDLIGGNIRLYGMPTTGSAANLRFDSGSAVLQWVTSSRRYKSKIAFAKVDPADVLKMRGRTWVDKGTVERLEEAGEDAAQVRRNIGFIAEELDQLPSMQQFVDYDDQGRPDAIQYDRLTVALLELAKTQQKQLDDQQTQITQLANRLDALERQDT
jgi:hypothetical protein